MNNTVNKNLKFKRSKDVKISLALMASFMVLTIQYVILISFDLINTTNASIVQTASKVIVGCVFIYALPEILKKNKLELIFAYLVGIIVFGINILFFPQNHEFVGEIAFTFFFMCIPAFVYSMSLGDWDILKSFMKLTSFFIFILCLILGFFMFTGSVSVGDYSMSLSFYLLIPAIMYLDEFLNNLSIKAFLIVFLSIIIILAFGSRGAILCLLVFGVLKLFRTNLMKNYKNTFFYIVLMVSIIFIFIFMRSILQFLNTLLLNFNISSRSLNLFLGEEVHLSGRNVIYQTATEAIVSNPIMGIGIGGDRVIIENYAYVHNIILEILINFGVIVGGLLLFLLLILIIRILFTKNKRIYNMMTIWISIGFVHLLVSSSYWTDIKFWIFLGLGLSALMNTKQKIVHRPIKSSNNLPRGE